VEELELRRVEWKRGELGSELRRVEWKRGELGSVKVYRITPEGLKAVGAQGGVARFAAVQPPPAQLAESAEERMGKHDLLLLRVMADGALWGIDALCFALSRAAGGSARSGTKYRTVARCLKKLTARGEVEALELRLARNSTRQVYRIAPKGLEVLRAPPQLERPAPRPKRHAAQPPRDPAVLLKLMEDGSLWTLGALAKATGWERTTVKRYLQRLAGLVEAVKLRVASWKRRTVATVYVYRLKRGGAAGPRAPSGREAQLQAPERGGRPDLDILLAMSDGALWTMGALKVATHHHKTAVKLHLERLTELGFVEAVEVRMARRWGPGFTVARVYRITQKGLEALESGQLPPLKASPRGRLEPPEGSDPMQLALWVLEWSAQAARMLLHLYARGEDSWSGVLRAAKGYRYKHGGGGQVARLLRLRELGLVEWELASPERARGARNAKRLVRLTEKGREVARAILELTTLPLGRESPPETSGERPPPERVAAAIPTTWEPPEDGDPLRLAIWVVNWSTRAARVLLHLRSRAGYEDTWYGVAIAAGGYRYKANSESLGAILLRLKELNLVEWRLAKVEQPAPRSARPTRIVHLTERGREVADAIAKLAAILREARAEPF
jgi:DNA-binding PadR family transcriptional regulator